MKTLYTKIPRRQFLRNSAAGVAVAALVPEVLMASPAQKKPNILLIMSDEHNASVAGFMGNKTVRTPHLDALAASGIVLENHYCNSPLCVPSRHSFTSGKYISRVHVWNNNAWLPRNDTPSIARMMTSAGYDPVLCGKMHYDYTRNYGFQMYPAKDNHFNDNYVTGRGHRMDPSEISSPALSSRFSQFHTLPKGGGIVQHDIKVTEGTLDFLSKRKTDDKPFFLIAGYLAPHPPFIIPDEWDMYKGKVPMPEIPEGMVDNFPTNYKNLRAGFEECNVAPDTVRRGRELYYGLTSWIDNEIGKVLAQLGENKEMAENTIVIYTSDHGENMGEHSMWWKNCMFDQATHVPTIISYPKRWKGRQRRAGVSSHVDLVKTMVELAGGTTPADWDGDSMVSTLDNPKLPWKDFSLSEYYAHEISSGYVMVRKGTWKYTYHTRANPSRVPEAELYNLATDPKEFNNLAKDPAYKEQIITMHRLMLAELKKSPEDSELEARKDFATGYHRTDRRPVKGGGGKEENS